MELANASGGHLFSPTIGPYYFNESYDAGAVSIAESATPVRPVDSSSGFGPAPAMDQNSMTRAATSRAEQEVLRLNQKSSPTTVAGRLEDEFSRIVISMQLSGKFFVAESPWAGAAMDHSKTMELICYRRNLFGVYGTVLIPESFAPSVTQEGERKMITGISAQLRAFENLDEQSVKIITIPIRRGSDLEAIASSSEPAPVTLDAHLSADPVSRSSTFAISWNRLQFRTATAKNHRRGTLRQEYRLHVVVVASLADNSTATIARAISVPIVVRGSTPARFQTRTDTLPHASLAWSGATSPLSPPKPEEAPHSQTQAAVAPIGWDFCFEAQETQESNAHKRHKSQPGIVQGTAPELCFDDLPQSYSTSPGIHSNLIHSNISKPEVTPLPMSESLAPDNLMMMDTSDVTTEDSTLTYEYYPLSIDDWTTPIEAIYRPHYVHQRGTSLDHVQTGGEKRFYKRKNG